MSTPTNRTTTNDVNSNMKESRSTFDPSVIDEIKIFKNQLTNLLNKNFTDPTLIIGLNNLILSNFSKWIANDLGNYYNLLEVELTHEQVEFNTIKFLDTLWLNFHYPIVKFFKANHKILAAAPEPKNGKEPKPKLRPVEIRKINDFLIKFIKSTFNFYLNLLKRLATEYHNDLLPKKFLNHFGFSVNSDAKATNDSNVQANLLYLIHKCLLCLGDLLRHRSFIEINYVLPNLSIKNFYKFKNLNSSTKLLPYYQVSVDYYKLCIMLLPALNEPYNHLGMIYNIVNNKNSSVYWFLRSTFTRISNYKLGLTNLNNLLEKDWLKKELGNLIFYQKQKFSNYQLHNIFLAITGFYYLPDVYRQSNNDRNILPNLSIARLQFIFLNLNFNEKLFKNQICSTSKELVEDFYLFQLTVLICFNSLATANRFNRFINQYLEFYLKALLKYNQNNDVSQPPQNALIFLRLLLNWLNCDGPPLSHSNIELLAENLNIMMEDRATELDSKPIRSYYFIEDLLFKDFKLIKYQFKDFNDDHLFKANNIDLLNNNFESLIIQGIPIFLDNATVKESNYQIDLKTEINSYERNLRIIAVLNMFYKVFRNKVKLTDKFVVQTEVKDKKKKKEPETKPKTPVIKKKYNEVCKAPVAVVDEEDSSEEELVEEDLEMEYDVEVEGEGTDEIDEIESFIRHHTTQLRSQIEEDIPIINNKNPNSSFDNESVVESTGSDISNSWKVEVNGTTFSNGSNIQETQGNSNHGSTNGIWSTSGQPNVILNTQAMEQPQTQMPVLATPYQTAPFPVSQGSSMSPSPSPHPANQWPQYQPYPPPHYPYPNQQQYQQYQQYQPYPPYQFAGATPYYPPNYSTPHLNYQHPQNGTASQQSNSSHGNNKPQSSGQ